LSSFNLFKFHRNKLDHIISLKSLPRATSPATLSGRKRKLEKQKNNSKTERTLTKEKNPVFKKHK